MAEKRRRLAERRRRLGFTQESLGAILDVDRTTVERWENGRRDPQPWVRPRLAAALELSVDELDQLVTDSDIVGMNVDQNMAPSVSGLSDHGLKQVVVGTGQRDLAETDDMQRRELLRLFSVVSTAVALTGGSAGVTAEQAMSATDHATFNKRLWQIYSLAPAKNDVMPLVRRQLSVLAGELARPHKTGTRQRLCALTAELLQLAGEIFFDRNAYTDAAHCYALGAQASREAEAFDLWACAMTRHAYLSVYERRFDAAASMLDLAASLAQRGDPALSTRHWVAAVQAEAYAGLGDLAACQHALEAADDVHTLTAQVHNGGWLRFDGTRLPEQRGTCYTSLGQAELAEAALNDALKQAITPRRRAAVLIDMAMIGIQRCDSDQVAAAVEAALVEARRSDSGMIDRRLHELQGHLAPLLHNKRLQRIDADITALTHAS